MRLYSTLARGLVELPEPPGPIGMYVCGPTVYARAHIGNARPYVIASWYKRWLRERGYDVTLVHNITDVNDKIYEAAPGASAERARQATEWYLEDTGRFGLDEVDHWPKVTESMDGIVALHRRPDRTRLRLRGRRRRLLPRRRLGGVRQALRARSPIRSRSRSRTRARRIRATSRSGRRTSPTRTRPGTSPWGEGRPGWHIECSAMAEQLLGPAFEIHGGGLDLVFPHHENELAQSRARGHGFAKVWMHNGMLRFTGEKMSKSVGNVETIAEVLDRWGRDTVLLFFLTAHWRSPIDFSDDRMADAQARADGLREVFRNPSEPAAADAWERFAAVLDDDFSTPAALALMHEWRDHDLLRRALDVFGLSGLAEQEEAPSEVHALAAGRQEARAARDFDRADELREQIEAAGWEVRDDSGGYRLVPRQ